MPWQAQYRKGADQGKVTQVSEMEKGRGGDLKQTETLGRMQAGKRGSREKSGKQTGQYKCGVRRQLEEQGEGALAWSSQDSFLFLPLS